MDLRTQLEEYKLSEKCFLKVYITDNGKTHIVEINYLNGKFIAEKMFPNNYNGFGDMEEFIKKYKTEEDVKQYFSMF